MTINEMMAEAHDNSRAHGFWDGVCRPLPPTVIASKLMLIVSEAAEALEESREYTINLYSYQDTGKGLPKPIGFASELADILIRVGDLAGVMDIDLETAVKEKMAYNRTRPIKHGKTI